MIYDSVEIVKEWLKEKGFGGLVLPGECGCSGEDLAPCGEDFRECQPGYLITKEEMTETESESWPDVSWIISTRKPE